MLKFCLLAFLLGFVEAQSVVDICTTPTHFVSETDRFHLISGNGDSPYANNLNCAFEIQTSFLPLIVSLDLVYFELEFESSCLFDLLCIGGVKFCGLLDGTFEYLLPEHSQFTIKFATDLSVTSRGFDIFVSTRFAGNETITQVVDGIVNGIPPEPVTNQVTYSPNSAANYVDRCSVSLFTSLPSAGPFTVLQLTAFQT